jgi:hypothetical protein
MVQNPRSLNPASEEGKVDVFKDQESQIISYLSPESSYLLAIIPPYLFTPKRVITLAKGLLSNWDSIKLSPWNQPRRNSLACAARQNLDLLLEEKATGSVDQAEYQNW